MKLTVFGTGYVGLVTGTCLAQVGNEVLCVDIDKQKIDMLGRGEIPIYEPGMDELVRQNIQHGRLHFSTDIEAGVNHGLFQFIAVGTPPDEDGSADLQHVVDVARSIGKYIDTYKIIVNKSTVPVGTADLVRETIQNGLDQRDMKIEFDMVSNPEFLKEGAAVDDFMKPDRIIVGVDNPRTAELLRLLYAPFNRQHERLVQMDIRSAELTKYAANAMLATKISFVNELANLAERLDADIEKVRIGIGADPRIGYHFIYPGCGYGGSCFPKDVKALQRAAQDVNYNAPLLNAVETVNERQKTVLLDKISKHFDGQVENRTFALWGLAFKPNTDDVRAAPSRTLLEGLWHRGARVKAFDPVAMPSIEKIYGRRQDLELCDSPEATVEDADALIIVTEWNIFRSPDFDQLKTQLRRPVIFDGRNLYDPDYLAKKGFAYHAIGRGKSPLC